MHLSCGSKNFINNVSLAMKSDEERSVSVDSEEFMTQESITIQLWVASIKVQGLTERKILDLKMKDLSAQAFQQGNQFYFLLSTYEI